MNIEHKFATVNGIKLHYVTSGNGPLVILLHGFPEFWYGWKNQIPAPTEHYRIIRFNNRVADMILPCSTTPGDNIIFNPLTVGGITGSAGRLG